MFVDLDMRRLRQRFQRVGAVPAVFATLLPAYTNHPGEWLANNTTAMLAPISASDLRSWNTI